MIFVYVNVILSKSRILYNKHLVNISVECSKSAKFLALCYLFKCNIWFVL